MKEPPLTEDDILAHIGVLLLNTQQFEFLLIQALKVVYADDEDLTPEKIYAEDKRTLGRLIKDLKKKSLIQDDAEQLLIDLLSDRNLFVHNLLNQDWYDTSTQNGRNRVMEFLGPFTLRLNAAIRLFVAIHMQHGDSIGFTSPLWEQVKSESGWQIDKYSKHTHKIRKNNREQDI